MPLNIKNLVKVFYFLVTNTIHKDYFQPYTYHNVIHVHQKINVSPKLTS